MALWIRYLNPDYDTAKIRRLCAGPDAPVDGERAIKSDRTTTLRQVEVDGRGIVIKRYNTKNLWHLLRRNFQRTRATNNYLMGERFSALGIHGPDTVAVIEEHWGPFAGRSWYLSEHVDSEMLLSHLDVDDWQPRFERLVDAVLDVFTTLRANRLSHGDLKATNWLVTDADLLLIDRDASRHHYLAASHRRALEKDKARFLKNWDNRPALRAAFADRLAAAGL